VNVERFGACKQRCEQVQASPSPPQDGRVMAVLNGNEFAKALSKTVEKWSKEKKTAIKSLMTLGPGEYEETVESLLCWIDEGLGKFAEDGMKNKDLIVKAETEEG
jgi:hypothetical protein